MHRKSRLFVLVLVLVLAMMAMGAGAAGSSDGDPTFVAPPGAQSHAAGEVLIGFQGDVTAADIALVRRHQGNVLHTFELIPTVLAAVPGHQISALRSSGRVAYVEPNGRVWALDHDGSETDPSTTWGVERVQAPQVWSDSGITGQGIGVAVLDTGVGPHRDLPALTACANTIDGTGCDDGHGHGTHVAGTIAALKNGIDVIGVSYDVNLYSVKVLNDSGSGTWASVAQGIEKAALDWNVHVINMSLGGSSGSNTLANAVAAAWDQGTLLVAAAGNSGNPGGRGNNVGYPAAYDEVIAVAGINRSNARASFSSTGPAVELSAPGVDVLSTWTHDTLRRANGTSMASPHVAGVAALTWAANPGLSNVQVREILADTALSLGHKNQYGEGLVQATAAVAAAQSMVSEPTGSIAGTVADADSGSGIAGATVSVNGVNTTTGGDGAYAIHHLPVGSYTVTATADGYEDGSSTNVSVTDGGTTTVNLALTALPPEPTGSIGGAVTGEGSAIEGATVTVEGSGFSESVTTDANGAYTVNEVPVGTYTVAASASGYVAASVTVDVVEDTLATADFDLEASLLLSMQVSDIDFWESRRGRWTDLNIRLTVSDADGAPVSGAAVTATLARSGASWSLSGTTNNSGQVQWQLRSAIVGTEYCLNPIDVVLDGYEYDGLAGNVETCHVVQQP